MLAYVVAYALLAVYVWRRSGGDRISSFFSNWVSFCQILALLLDDGVHSMRFFTSLLLLEFDPMSAKKCLSPGLSFIGKFYFAIFWAPLFLALQVGLIALVYRKFIYPVRLEKMSRQLRLEGLQLGELRKRAKAVEVDPAALGQIDDADDPKAAVVQLILAASVSQSGGATAVDANMLASMFAETR